MAKPTYKINSQYVYDCDGIEKQLDDNQETLVDHDKYFCVVCSDCCNVPVLHLLTRGEVNV